LGQRSSRDGGAMAWWWPVVAPRAGDFLGCHYRPRRVRAGASDPKRKLRNLRVVSEITWSPNFR
jgi:hypothetical protein